MTQANGKSFVSYLQATIFPAWRESQGRAGGVGDSVPNPSFSKEIIRVRQLSYRSVINVIKSLLGNDYALNLEVTPCRDSQRKNPHLFHCLTHPDSTSCETGRQSTLLYALWASAHM